MANERALRRVGVFGGTFDPIHLGHLIAASEVAHSWQLDRVVFVPAGRPWQKMRYSSSEDRFLMTALGATSDARFVVSRLEIDRRGPTYTADTMAALRDFHGEDVQLFFIAGADAILQLSSWKDLERLAGLSEVLAVARTGFDLSRLSPAPGWPRIHVFEMRTVDISATDIRGRVKRGEPIDFLVPGPVVEYIRERGLYLGEEEVADAS